MPLTPYNLTIVNATQVYGLVQTVNTTLMGGWFGILLLISLFIIIFISIQRFQQNPMLTFSQTCLICAMISLMLRGLSLVPDLAVFILWIMAAISLFTLFIRD